jgi:hypothetical protein
LIRPAVDRAIAAVVEGQVSFDLGGLFEPAGLLVAAGSGAYVSGVLPLSEHSSRSQRRRAARRGVSNAGSVATR